MLDKEIEQALNAQLNNELYSAYYYLSMSTYFEALSYGGFSSWMKMQAQEEIEHSMKYYNYIFERQGQVTLTAVAGPKTSWESPLETFEDAYAHEVQVTKDINKIVDLAISKSDHATNHFLQWFVGEQVEEEATTSDLVTRLKRIGDNPAALVMLDRELASRPAEG